MFLYPHVTITCDCILLQPVLRVARRHMAAACHDDQSRPHLAVNYDFLTPVDEGERERERERGPILEQERRVSTVEKGAGLRYLCCLSYGAQNLRSSGVHEGSINGAWTKKRSH